MSETIKQDIIRLIDGELSEDESIRVRELIQKSEELEKFYNDAKRSKESLESYFNSQAVADSNVRQKEFIKKKLASIPESIDTETRQTILSQILKRFKPAVYVPMALGATAVSVLIIYYLNVYFYNFFDVDYFFAPNVSTVGFSEQSKDYSVGEYRSLKTLEDQFGVIINDLIDLSITTAKIIPLAEEKSPVNLQLTKYDKEASCYFGILANVSGAKEKFRYCYMQENVGVSAEEAAVVRTVSALEMAVDVASRELLAAEQVFSEQNDILLMSDKQEIQLNKQLGPEEIAANNAEESLAREKAHDTKEKALIAEEELKKANLELTMAKLELEMIRERRRENWAWQFRLLNEDKSGVMDFSE